MTLREDFATGNQMENIFLIFKTDNFNNAKWYKCSHGEQPQRGEREVFQTFKRLPWTCFPSPVDPFQSLAGEVSYPRIFSRISADIFLSRILYTRSDDSFLREKNFLHADRPRSAKRKEKNQRLRATKNCIRFGKSFCNFSAFSF